MELAFQSRSIREICENETHATCELGSKRAEALKHRLADLRAATSVMDLLVGQPRILDSADPKAMILDLSDGHRLVFCANHTTNPVTECGKLDWTKVYRIRVLRIERDHDHGN